MRVLLVLLLFCLPTSVMADAELHAVGVYEGNIRTDGRIHGGEVRILVDRNADPVILSVGSYEPVRWFIETTEETRVETIILHGYRPEKSEVYLNGLQVTPRILQGVGYVYENEGIKFRQMLEALQAETNIEALASFHGSYRASPEPFVIDRIVPNPRNHVDHLKDLVRPDAVPEPLQQIRDMASDLNAPTLRFSNGGFILTENGETTVFEPTLDVPDISHPVGAAFDKEGRRMFGVTLGGEGFIYLYDMSEDRWSILASMEQNDAAGMLYDAEADRLIFGLRLIQAGLAVYDLRRRVLSRVPVQAQDLAGFTDLYDPGNAPAADLVPIAISGNLLLVRAGGRQAFRRAPGKSRTYLVDLMTGRATLVAFDNDG